MKNEDPSELMDENAPLINPVGRLCFPSTTGWRAVGIILMVLSVIRLAFRTGPDDPTPISWLISVGCWLCGFAAYALDVVMRAIRALRDELAINNRSSQ